MGSQSSADCSVFIQLGDMTFVVDVLPPVAYCAESLRDSHEIKTAVVRCYRRYPLFSLCSVMDVVIDILGTDLVARTSSERLMV